MKKHSPASPFSAEKESKQRQGVRLQSSTRSLLYGLSLLTLAATISPLSRLQLNPLYGERSVSAPYPPLHFAILCFGLVTFPLICHGKLPHIAPLMAVGLPTMQHSPLLRKPALEYLGIKYIPLLTELLTSVPLVSLLIFHTFRTLQFSPLFTKRSKAAKHGLLLLFVSGYYLFAQKTIAAFFPLHFANGHFLTSRASIYWGVCALISLHFPLKNTLIGLSVYLVVFAVSPTSALSSRFVTSLPTDFGLKHANKVLEPHGWKVLERGEGVTGYVSVLEHTDMNYRLLRCDHSLLGGEWLLTEERRIEEGWTKEEPVFGVFEMMEAVRLVKGLRSAKEQERALVIGLGIGTAPKALLAHSIPTTILELDPLVHAYATKYFSLPANHTAILSDAIPWVTSTATSISSYTSTKDPPQRYTYILHDVFTGGSTPLPLFTHSFITALRTLLNPSGGVIAINFAGDLTLPPMRSVLLTINTVFEGRCRAYRDMPPLSSTGQKSESEQGDMLNLVVFCVNNAAMWPLAFRQAIEADFLGSTSRRRFLMPRKEMEVVMPTSTDGGELMTESNINNWEGQELEAARRHWKLMREAVPAIVWETW